MHHVITNLVVCNNYYNYFKLKGGLVEPPGYMPVQRSFRENKTTIKSIGTW